MIYFPIILGALLNRARGNKFWEHFESTTGTRWLFAYLMGGLAASLAWPNIQLAFEAWLCVMGFLYFWCVFGWDLYWSAAIGDQKYYSRMWGLKMLTLRHTLGLPCLLGLSVLSGHWTPYVFIPLLFGVPYYISGYFTPRRFVIAVPEMVIGAMWVFAFSKIL